MNLYGCSQYDHHVMRDQIALTVSSMLAMILLFYVLNHNWIELLWFLSIGIIN